MRKVIVLSFITLDGIMQAPGGPDEDRSGGFEHGGWVAPFFDEFSGRIMAEQMAHPFDLLLGRKTYDIFAGYWPKQADETAAAFKRATKYVVSRTLKTAGWAPSVLINGDVPAEIRRIKDQDGPELQVHGSGDLIQTLLGNDLVDELWLKTFPITLGRGKRLFGEGTRPAGFTLLNSRVSPLGVTFANYARAGAVKTGTFA